MYFLHDQDGPCNIKHHTFSRARQVMECEENWQKVVNYNLQFLYKKKKKVHLTLDLIAYGTRGLNDVSSFNQWLLARRIGRCLPKLSSFTMDKHTVSMHRLAPEICLNISWWGWGGVRGGGAVTRHGLARPWVCLSLSWGATPTPEFISLLGSAIARLMAVFIYANETWSASRRDGTRYDKYTGDGKKKK